MITLPLGHGRNASRNAGENGIPGSPYPRQFRPSWFHQAGEHYSKRHCKSIAGIMEARPPNKAVAGLGPARMLAFYREKPWQTEGDFRARRTV
jgi:hypothetical protein